MPTFIGISIVEQSRYFLVQGAQTIRNVDCKLAVSAEYRCFTGTLKPKLGTTSLEQATKPWILIGASGLRLSRRDEDIYLSFAANPPVILAGCIEPGN